MSTLSLERLSDGLFAKAANSITNLLAQLGAAQQAAHDFERLSGLSDAALAKDGKSRSEAAREIFHRHFD